MDIKHLLERSAREHQRLCPRQILGVRMGPAGMCALGFEAPVPNKQLLVIAETDGCFADGLIAATGCTVGHRTLRMEDYGKIAAPFVEVRSAGTIRAAPAPEVHAMALRYAPDEPRHYSHGWQPIGLCPLSSC